MSDVLDELAEIDVQTWVVLAVGAATVIAQVLASRWASRTADRQAGAAELQAQAAQAALDRESAARLIAVLKMAATRAGQITLFNSGEHAAMDVSLAVVREDGNEIASTWGPTVSPHDAAVFEFNYPDDLRLEFQGARHLEAKWEDGRGKQTERLRLFRTQ